MRLLTAASRSITYPDRAQDEFLWVEVYSHGTVGQFELVKTELHALAAASLVLQLETGRPVVKLLNLSSVLTEETVRDDPSTPALLNYISGLVDDPSIHAPDAVLAAAVEGAPPDVAERFATAPVFLKRVRRFMTAVGHGGDELTRPSIHLSLDHPSRDDSELSPGVLGRRWPSLGQRLLWWQANVVEGADHLFRPIPSPDWIEGSPARELVPFPVVRVEQPSGGADGIDAHSISVAHDTRSRNGFSLKLAAATTPDSTYAQNLVGRALAVADGLINDLRVGQQ